MLLCITLNIVNFYLFIYFSTNFFMTFFIYNHIFFIRNNKDSAFINIFILFKIEQINCILFYLFSSLKTLYFLTQKLKSSTNILISK